MEALLSEYTIWQLLGAVIIVGLFIYGFTSRGSNTKKSSGGSSSNSSQNSGDGGGGTE